MNTDRIERAVRRSETVGTLAYPAIVLLGRVCRYRDSAAQETLGNLECLLAEDQVLTLAPIRGELAVAPEQRGDGGSDSGDPMDMTLSICSTRGLRSEEQPAVGSYACPFTDARGCSASYARLPEATSRPWRALPANWCTRMAPEGCA